MADHEFFGTGSFAPGTEADHVIQRAQLDSAIAEAKNRASHTGTQLMVTISDAQSYVDGRIGSVLDIGGAPETLDTLNELAAALNDDANFAAAVTGQISGLDTRIDALEADTGIVSHKQDVGDGAVSVFTITHNFALGDPLDVDVVVRRKSDGQRVFPVDKAATANTVTVDFGSAVPAVNSYRVICTPL